MAVQRTFSILKPEVTRRDLTGAVNQRVEAAGLRIVAQKHMPYDSRAGGDVLWRACASAHSSANWSR